MFNHIRKVPYVAGDGKGGISYFAGGFSNQFGLETQIVAAMCKSSESALDESGILNGHRRDPFLRNHCACAQGSTDGRPQKPASSRHTVGGGDVFTIQFSPECFSRQEWWLSLLSTTVLGSLGLCLFTRPGRIMWRQMRRAHQHIQTRLESKSMFPWETSTLNKYLATQCSRSRPQVKIHTSAMTK